MHHSASLILQILSLPPAVYRKCVLLSRLYWRAVQVSTRIASSRTTYLSLYPLRSKHTIDTIISSPGLTAPRISKCTSAWRGLPSVTPLSLAFALARRAPHSATTSRLSAMTPLMIWVALGLMLIAYWPTATGKCL